MKPIYKPTGKAKEYGDYAVNIYTGCTHGCIYCYAPRVLHRTPEIFHSSIIPREGIVESLKDQIEREGIIDKTIHLCFTCDPYPTLIDNSVTRDVIKVIKKTGNHVQILTKGDGRRDFNLLDENDWYGITISNSSDREAAAIEPCAIRPTGRLVSLLQAKERGIKTWISLEPVMSENVLDLLKLYPDAFDKVKIGKLNYMKSDIDWKAFGLKAEALCKELGINYYIKEGLRKDMEET